MNIKTIRNILDSSNGRTMTVTFVKKTDGSVRVMNCRIGVKKHLKGGESTIAHKEELYGVFDMQNGGYRCLDLNNIIKAKVDGVEIKFKEV